jgi:acyl dehydratase
MGKEMTLAQLRNLTGQELTVSEWMPILQDRIQKFAEATGDHQWIHVDPERCKTESPFGKPIAHGFLTLSLLPALMGDLIFLSDTKLTINYGLNKVRFITPVPVGSLVRGRTTLLKVEDVTDAAQSTWQVTIEREGSDKPVCVAESIMRHYF